MAVVYRCVGILTVDVVFFRSPGVFHSQDSFPSTFLPRLWETSSGVVAVGVFAAVARPYCLSTLVGNEPASDFTFCLPFVINILILQNKLYIKSFWSLLLGFTTFFNMLGRQRRFRHRAWKVQEILLRSSNFGLRFFTCRKSTTRYSRLYFLSEGSHTQDFYALKKFIDPDRDRTREPQIQRRVW